MSDERNNYLGFVRWYGPTTIGHLGFCDSDAEGAFKVYQEDVVSTAQARIAELKKESAMSATYLSNLLTNAFPQIEPLRDLYGLCMQVDNGFAVGLKMAREELATAKHATVEEIDHDREHKAALFEAKSEIYRLVEQRDRLREVVVLGKIEYDSNQQQISSLESQLKEENADLRSQLKFAQQLSHEFESCCERRCLMPEKKQLALFLAIVTIAWLTLAHFFTISFPAGHMP